MKKFLMVASLAFLGYLFTSQTIVQAATNSCETECRYNPKNVKTGCNAFCNKRRGEPPKAKKKIKPNPPKSDLRPLRSKLSSKQARYFRTRASYLGHGIQDVGKF